MSHPATSTISRAQSADVRAPRPSLVHPGRCLGRQTDGRAGGRKRAGAAGSVGPGELPTRVGLCHHPTASSEGARVPEPLSQRRLWAVNFGREDFWPRSSRGEERSGEERSRAERRAGESKRANKTSFQCAGWILIQGSSVSTAMLLPEWSCTSPERKIGCVASVVFVFALKEGGREGGRWWRGPGRAGWRGAGEACPWVWMSIARSSCCVVRR